MFLPPISFSLKVSDLAPAEAGVMEVQVAVTSRWAVQERVRLPITQSLTQLFRNLEGQYAEIACSMQSSQIYWP